MISFADKLKEISFALFDIQYEFEGYSDNYYAYFKFREYKIALAKAKDNICLSKKGKKLVEGTWQEVKILEQIGKIFVRDACKVGK